MASLRTPLCDVLGIEYPIIQGGMAWLGTWELAAAVSNAGGLGIIGAGDAPPEWVREQIERARQATDRPFGVNVMLLASHAREVIEVVIEERVPVVATGAGNPGTLVRRFREAGSKVVPVVAAVALARRLERSGADVIVGEGTEAGGHIGDTTTMALIPQLVDAVDLPVVAAGGIADGRGLAAALALGAQGVQMGTRFICAEECIAHPDFKQRILAAKDRATVETGRSLGHPVRALENKMTRQFADMEKAGASEEELIAFGTGKLAQGVVHGDLQGGSLMAGQIAGMVKEIKPVRDIVQETIAEAEAVIERMGSLASNTVRV